MPASSARLARGRGRSADVTPCLTVCTVSWRPPGRRQPRIACALRRSRDEAEAFTEVYDAYHERVLAFFARRVLDVDMAWDLTSETFAKALQQCDQFRGRTPEEEQGWLFAIARSQLSHYWRRGEAERAALARMGVEVPELADADIERVEALAGLGELKPSVADALARATRRSASRRGAAGRPRAALRGSSGGTRGVRGRRPGSGLPGTTGDGSKAQAAPANP